MAVLWCISKVSLPDVFFWLSMPLVIPMIVFCITVVYFTERLKKFDDRVNKTLGRLKEELYD